MSNSVKALNPAAGIIEKFGGAERVMEITSASRTRVYRWTQPKERGGTDGLVPILHAQTLLAYADANGVAISADDFIPRRQASAEVAA